MVKCCKGCDVHMLCVEEIIEVTQPIAKPDAIYSKKIGQKHKDSMVFELHFWSIAYQTRIWSSSKCNNGNYNKCNKHNL